MGSKNTMPLWRRPEQIPAAQRPAGQLWHWLTVSGSLTSCLRQDCAGEIAVRLLSEATINSDPNQTLLAESKTGQALFCREVIISSGTSPLVFARTLTQLSALEKDNHWLTQQGNNPLGDTLFSRSGTQRRHLEVAALKNSDTLYQDAIAQVISGYAPNWARRSVIYSDELALLIVECFFEKRASHTP